MLRGLRVAVVLLLGASLALVPAPLAGSSTTSCGVVVAQDDAHSQRDAGASPTGAVEIPYEDEYPASISYPQGPAVDAEDWYRFAWTSEEEHRVMVNVSTRAAGLSYTVDHRLPAAHLDLEAYAPGEEEPRHEGEVGPDGVLRLDFVTERTDWEFRVSLPETSATDDCPADHQLDGSADAQLYNMYVGCKPHCVQVNI
jgi:hypothetical protein